MCESEQPLASALTQSGHETSDILLGRPPKLDVATLQRRMIGSKRGGYCFERNTLFGPACGSLGFGMTNLRVVRGLAIDAPRPAIHMVLKLELPERAHLADAGSTCSSDCRLTGSSGPVDERLHLLQRKLAVFVAVHCPENALVSCLEFLQ